MTFEIYSMYPNTEKIGTVRSNGAVLNSQGIVLGMVDRNGQIKNRAGELLGRVNHSGDFRAKSPPAAFRMDLKGGIYLGQRLVGKVNQVEKGVPVYFAQWAAGLLLLGHADGTPDEVSPIFDTHISPPDKLENVTLAVKLEKRKFYQVSSKGYRLK